MNSNSNLDRTFLELLSEQGVPTNLGPSAMSRLPTGHATTGAGTTGALLACPRAVWKLARPGRALPAAVRPVHALACFQRQFEQAKGSSLPKTSRKPPRPRFKATP